MLILSEFFLKADLFFLLLSSFLFFFFLSSSPPPLINTHTHTIVLTMYLVKFSHSLEAIFKKDFKKMFSLLPLRIFHEWAPKMICG